jgi:polyribonucleotide 5'-hydroxyl-kinase
MTSTSISSKTLEDALSSLPPVATAGTERHVLKAEEELRLEVSFAKNSTFQITLRHGSAELQGIELALNQTYTLAPDTGGIKIAIFTWHGCIVDVFTSDPSILEISYTSDETSSNIAVVNTHAQLEALRDQAAIQKTQGPRVLIVGPKESGKTSLAKILIAYAVKLGRTPILVDLDPADNCMTIPGTISACVMDADSITLETYATTGIPIVGGGGSEPNASPPQQTAHPIVLWHASTHIVPELFREQVTAIGNKIDRRLNIHTNTQTGDTEDWTKYSGCIVNTNGWIQDEGFQLLLHTVQALQISVVLVVGHDRLYSMMKSAIEKKNTTQQQQQPKNSIKVIKVPRSGGVVSRGDSYILQCRSRSIKRYFYGSMVDAPSKINTSAASSSAGSSAAAAAAAASTIIHPHRVPQLTPFLLQIPFAKITLYKMASISLSASLLPVAATQSTEPVQLQTVECTEKLKHFVLAVCHPQAVAAYEQSGRAKDLYQAGVAGFVVVEKVLVDTETIHLLSPCAMSLPSHTLLVGDITWME